LIKNIIVTVVTFLGLVLPVCAAEPLPWSTTYDCDDWSGATEGSNPIDCDGLTYGLLPQEGNCTPEEITISANNPDGDGGKGQLHPYCDGGTNNGGGTIIAFSTPQPEIWVRTYIKYESGFAFENDSPQTKIFYVYRERGQSEVVIPKWESTDTFLLGSSSDVVSFPGRGWETLNGGSVGDGEWHYLEFHIKADTDGTDGVAEMWLDDLPVQAATNVDFGMAGYAGWIDMTIGSNTLTVIDGPWMSYYDDIAISNTGYIGPLDASPTTREPFKGTLNGSIQ